MTKKTEFAIGEEVKVGRVTAVCQESSDAEDCCDCCFTQLCEDVVELAGATVCGYCSREYRTDGNDVIFKLKEE
ncbi:MAG: hypothetical protein SNI70_10770 [Rikenellaceae bacterium]